MSFRNETIWIIGASSGIGYALAKRLADQGAQLILSARRTEKLESLNDALGGAHILMPLDASDEDQVKTTFQNIQDMNVKPDRIIFMAGIYEPSAIVDIKPGAARQIMDVNFMGAFYVTQAALQLFENQKAGQIALCGSVAAYIGLPRGQPYSASKAALRNFAESLRAETPKHIDVKLISPGFVRTPLTDKNKFKMPLMIEPEDAAAAIAKELHSRKFEIHFPKRFTWPFKFFCALPYLIILKCMRKS